MTEQFVGIDLGTSNSAISLWSREDQQSQIIPIPQMENPDFISAKELLPSVVYFPLENEQNQFNVSPPWQEGNQLSLGSWAKQRGPLVPDRFVRSAKSWLCQKNISRSEPILPWDSSISTKISPVDASQAFLEYLKEAFQHQRGSSLGPNDTVVITVPASFDEAARDLTHKAALAAGFHQPILLEEPQAALYSWINEHSQDWQKKMTEGDIILVCDIGGGTSDFSLISVQDNQGSLELNRIAVGHHLLLGGDNIDLAIAYSLQDQLEENGTELDQWQFQSLLHSSAAAKEALLSDPSKTSYQMSIASRSSNLFASALSTELTRDHLEALILDGFFPMTQRSELPRSGDTTGFQEIGLAFESEPEISRHLAKFLQDAYFNAKASNDLSEEFKSKVLDSESEIILPTKVLFNGGVLKASLVKQRVLSLLNSWCPEHHQMDELDSSSLDLAVAKGAAYYAKIRGTGEGLRIRSATAKSYYIGLEETRPAVPGVPRKIGGLCIAPQGTEEGQILELPQKTFGLKTGQSVEFRFFSSNVRSQDRLGSLVKHAEKHLTESTPIKLFLDDSQLQGDQMVPVSLQVNVTELGILDLLLKHKDSDQTWKLEFDVRREEQIL